MELAPTIPSEEEVDEVNKEEDVSYSTLSVKAASIKHPFFHKSFKEVMQQFTAETKFVLRFGTVVNV